MENPYSAAREAVNELFKESLSYAYVENDGSIWMEGSFELRELQYIVNALEHAVDDLFK